MSQKLDNLKFIFHFARKYRKYLLVLYVCLAIEAIIMSLLPIFIGILADEVLYKKSIDNFLKVSSFYGLSLILLTVFYVIHPNIWQYLMTRFIFDVKLKMYKQLINSHAEYLSNAKTGDLLSRLEKDATEFMHIIQRNIFHFFNGVVKTIIAFGIVSYYNWKISLLMVFIVPISVYVSKKSGKLAKEYSKEERENYGKYISGIFELLKGLKEVKLLSAEKRTTIRFIKDYKKIVGVQIKTSFLQLKTNQIMELMKMVFSNCFYIISGILALKGEITIGAFIVISDYFFKVSGTLVYLVNNNFDMEIRQASVVRVRELVELDGEDLQNNNNIVIDGDIEFRNIHFSYDDERKILKNINLTIKKGEKIALVGESGGGKTTIANLLLRFYEPNQGEILINNKKIDKYNLKTLRQNIGIVQQDNVIFEGSIRMNLTLGNNRKNDKEIMKACECALLSDFIANLPNGLDTMIGQGYREISGGEKQRIGIARIFLKDPKIIIFDEATSALDKQSEKLINEAWKIFAKDKTVITIAHRLSTILQSGKIAVLKDNEINYYNTHNNLLKICDYYKQLFEEEFQQVEVDFD